MSSRARKILEQAFALPASERAMMALELARTVDDDPAQVEAAWTAETVRRLEAVERGEVETVDLAEVRVRIRQALRKGYTAVRSHRALETNGLRPAANGARRERADLGSSAHEHTPRRARSRTARDSETLRRVAEEAPGPALAASVALAATGRLLLRALAAAEHRDPL